MRYIEPVCLKNPEGESHDYEILKPATCTAYSLRRCRHCGEIKEENKDALPHDFDEWRPVPEEERTPERHMMRTCRTCGCVAYRPEDTDNPLLNEAFRHIGEKYRLFKGDTYLETPDSYYEKQGVDCSHFIYFLIRDVLGYDTMDEPYADNHVPYDVPKSWDWPYYGSIIRPEDARPGDIISFIGHVVIYLGGTKIIHASNSKPYPAGGVKISDYAQYGEGIDAVLHYYVKERGKQFLGINRIE